MLQGAHGPEWKLVIILLILVIRMFARCVVEFQERKKGHSGFGIPMFLKVRNEQGDPDELMQFCCAGQE